MHAPPGHSEYNVLYCSKKHTVLTVRPEQSSVKGSLVSPPSSLAKGVSLRQQCLLKRIRPFLFPPNLQFFLQPRATSLCARQ